MTKSVRSAHAEKGLNANKSLINSKFFSPNSGGLLTDSQAGAYGLGTDPVESQRDEWGMRTRPVLNVTNIELLGAGGRYEKKVIKKDLQLNSGHQTSDRVDDNDDMVW